MGRKVLKDKDPSAPKPPLNSFLEFSKEERPRLLIESGNLSATEVAKEIGSRWRSLTKDEKEKFEERFHQNKKKYQAVNRIWDSVFTFIASKALVAKRPVIVAYRS